MITVNVIQGTPEWHAHRATHFNASDAPAMMGVSPYETRSQLMHRLHTGIAPEVDAGTQRRFDNGHRFEELARPLAVAIIGQELYPVTGVHGLYSASFDGLTMDDSVAFEHKTINSDIKDSFDNGGDGQDLPMRYRVQMEQQLMVSGANKTLFMATKWDSDTLIEVLHCWYKPDMGLRGEIVAGWAQFNRDRAEYVPAKIAEMPAPAITVALPALFIHAKGEITTNNMAEYGHALTERLAKLRSIVLDSDQDFSDAKQAAKILRADIVSANAVKAGMLAQTMTVGEAVSTIESWCENMRLTALQLEKDVELKDKQKKELMVTVAKEKYTIFANDLDSKIYPLYVNTPTPYFGEAIKGKRNYASMQDAVDTMLANAKIAAESMAKDYAQKRDWLNIEAKDCASLFPDAQVLVSKPMEDFQSAVKARIAQKMSEDEAARKAEQNKAFELLASINNGLDVAKNNDLLSPDLIAEIKNSVGSMATEIVLANASIASKTQPSIATLADVYAALDKVDASNYGSILQFLAGLSRLTQG